MEQKAKVIPITVAPRGLHGAKAKVGKKEDFIEDKPFGSEIKKLIVEKMSDKNILRRFFSRKRWWFTLWNRGE